MLNQVEATDAALELIEEIKKDYGDVIFHQSGGCCDGSAPMCFQKGDFLIDEKLRSVELTDDGFEKVEKFLVNRNLIKPDESLYTTNNLKFLKSF